jgi:hypothetical protein
MLRIETCVKYSRVLYPLSQGCAPDFLMIIGLYPLMACRVVPSLIVVHYAVILSIYDEGSA